MSIYVVYKVIIALEKRLLKTSTITDDIRLFLDRSRAKLQLRKFCKFNRHRSLSSLKNRSIIEDVSLLGKAYSKWN